MFKSCVAAVMFAFSNCFLSSVFLQDFVTRAKLGVQHMVQKVGFFGILACASVS